MCFYCSVTSQFNSFTNDDDNNNNNNNNNTNSITNKAFLFHIKWRFVLFFSSHLFFKKCHNTCDVQSPLSTYKTMGAQKGKGSHILCLPTVPHASLLLPVSRKLLRVQLSTMIKKRPSNWLDEFWNSIYMNISIKITFKRHKNRVWTAGEVRSSKFFSFITWNSWSYHSVWYHWV